MERAIRVVSVERGHDPRDFALLAFGGAGGMHACEIAETLDIGTVDRAAPRRRAVGARHAARRRHARTTPLTVLRAGDDVDRRRARHAVRAAGRRAERDLAREGFRAERTRDRAPARRALRRPVLRARPCRSAPDFRAEFDRRARADLRLRRTRRRPIEVVTLRVVAIGRTDKPALPHVRARRRRSPSRTACGQARFGGARVDGRVLPVGRSRARRDGRRARR